AAEQRHVIRRAERAAQMTCGGDERKTRARDESGDDERHVERLEREMALRGDRPRGDGDRREAGARYGTTQAAHGREGSGLHRSLRLHVRSHLASIARRAAKSAREATTMPTPRSVT